MSVVLFGCGSRMIVDVEESCARLGLEIAAIVKNFEGPDCALSDGRVVKAENIDPAITSIQPAGAAPGCSMRAGASFSSGSKVRIILAVAFIQLLKLSIKSYFPLPLGEG